MSGVPGAGVPLEPGAGVPSGAGAGVPLVRGAGVPLPDGVGAGREHAPGDRLVVLVRHGQAAAGWDGDADPGLSDAGRSQAERVAAELLDLAGARLVVSPLRRTRETAEPIGVELGVVPNFDPAVGEVVAPVEHAALESRGAWLRGFMAGGWAEADAGLLAWRSGVLDALASLPGDAVVVTHFVAINAAVGAALGDDRVVSFRPGYCSRTVLRYGEGGVDVLRLGDVADTVVR